MPAVSIHHSPEHATGPGADPGPNHGEGQPTNGSRAQVGDTGRQTRTFEGAASSKSLCPSRLCTLEGATVSSAAELETGRYYVAVGTERLKKLPYVELLVPKDTGR